MHLSVANLKNQYVIRVQKQQYESITCLILIIFRISLDKKIYWTTLNSEEVKNILKDSGRLKNPLMGSNTLVWKETSKRSILEGISED